MMSVFGSIMSAIFGHSAASAPAASTTRSSSQSTSTASQPTGAPAGSVDVTAVLDKLAAQSKEKGLDWRKSIIDLMKLLNLDSSLGARKQLAQELHYTGNTNDSASMNVWLHQQVMIKLAENGGKVPDDLKH
jgi:Domain of unknown function (DUF3597)